MLQMHPEPLPNNESPEINHQVNWRKIVSENEGSLRLFIQKRLKTYPENEIDEVLQEVWCAAIQQIGTFRNESTIKTWLHAIAKNVCKETLRASRAQKRAKEDLDEDALLAAADHGENPEELFTIRRSSQLISQLVSKAIERLPKSKKDVVLAILDEVDYGTITKELGIPVDTARTRLHYAKCRIAALLLKNKARLLNELFTEEELEALEAAADKLPKPRGLSTS